MRLLPNRNFPHGNPHADRDPLRRFLPHNGHYANISLLFHLESSNCPSSDLLHLLPGDFLLPAKDEERGKMGEVQDVFHLPDLSEVFPSLDFDFLPSD